jgi:hypothetical protein
MDLLIILLVVDEVDETVVALVRHVLSPRSTLAEAPATSVKVFQTLEMTRQ